MNVILLTAKLYDADFNTVGNHSFGARNAEDITVEEFANLIVWDTWRERQYADLTYVEVTITEAGTGVQLHELLVVKEGKTRIHSHPRERYCVIAK